MRSAKVMPEITKWEPQEISDVDYAFPATVSHLMPKYEDIPSEFRNWNSRNKWMQMVADWFFCGLADLKMSPKERIDTEKALRHIGTIMGSFEPKHEHKEAACAYLLSLWFDDATYTKCAREVRR